MDRHLAPERPAARRVRAALPAALAAAALAVVLPVGSSAAPATPAPHVRAYKAKIVRGTGRAARDRGSLTVTVTLTSSGERPGKLGGLLTYKISIRVAGTRCGRRSASCVSLKGTLTGTAETLETPPDVPGRIKFQGSSGRVSPLGPVKAEGVLVGTGFILKVGARHLELNLISRHGRLGITGQGPVVPGGSAP